MFGEVARDKIEPLMENAPLITALNRRYGIAGVAEIVVGNGGLPKVRVASASAAGEIYLHGAHVTSWCPTGASEALFLSSQSKWEVGKAIRGGIPICFPWFGDKVDDESAPAHGFVRTKSWQLDAIDRFADAVTVSMSTASDETTRKWWPSDFRLIYRATFGSELQLELEIGNTGEASLRFEEALHAYFEVGDVRTSQVKGLDAVPYLDKTDGYREKTQQGDVTITSETDRVYLDTQSPVELLDRVLQRRVTVAKENSRTTVIWNPWSEKAKTISDLGDDQWTKMLCIETSNVLGYAAEVAPGLRHRMTAVIRLDSVGARSLSSNG